MKHPIPPHPALNLAIIGCLLALLGCGLGRAQDPIAERLDVYFGKTTLQTIDGNIDSYTVSPDNIIKVDKSDSSPNQLSIVGLAAGSAMLTVKSEGRTLLYDVAVSIAPERLYINLNESKRLTFPNPIDDTSLSQPGIVRVVQPDTGDPATADKVLLVEADLAGKTTLTVTSKGNIYRYFISTFENRGADVLEIQNDFSAKGYRGLTITFDKDQAIIGGTVPTQEELDDAVRIVKQFTQFVVVKATLGQEVGESEYTEQESIIINNIQRIANVKGLIVRVKFPMPTVVTTSTYTKSTGDFVNPTTTTTPQGGTIRGSGFQPPAPNPNQPAGTGDLEPKPQQNTTEQVTTTEDTSIPEKIFLYGDMDDDLAEARVLRVARTFCPFIVNLMTVKDPIQLRTQIRFMQVTDTNASNIGFDWSNGGAGPQITLGFGGNALRLLPNPINVFKNYITSAKAGEGVTAAASASAILNLFQTLGVTKEIREADLFLTNGQPGWYSEGQVQTYVSSTTTTLAANGLNTVTFATSQIFLGVNMDIAPLNLVDAGGTEPIAQKILGVPGTLGSGYTVTQDAGLTAAKVDNVATAIQKSGGAPFIDNSVKYVDENGLIGMNISTQLSIPGVFGSAGPAASAVTLPNVFVRTTRTRVNLRDGQTVAIDGLIDKSVSNTITQVPYLSKIPLFSFFFKYHQDGPSNPNNNEEVIVLVTPHIIRMRDPDSARYPKPYNPEMQDIARQYGDVPIIKPVRYDAEAVDLRPESPKDMQDAKSDAAPSDAPVPALHATGGMQTLQPPVEPAPAPAPTPPPPSGVDNSPPASDISRQPSSAPLAPSSTLP